MDFSAVVLEASFHISLLFAAHKSCRSLRLALVDKSRFEFYCELQFSPSSQRKCSTSHHYGEELHHWPYICSDDKIYYLLIVR